MAREDKTQYAVLGLLSIEPMSGYDMKSYISESIGFFWQESYGQLYPALKKLHREGSVKREVEKHKGKPDRHVYSLTMKGREKLRSWLKRETEPQNLRIEMLLKLFFGGVIGPEHSMKHLQRLLEVQQARLRAFTEADKRLKAEEIEDEEFQYQYATLRYGLYITRARIKWCKETLSVLSEQVNKSKKKNTK